MPSIMEVFTQVCAHRPPLIAVSRHKDVRTGLKYLAMAYGSTPEQLTFTPDIEAGYREQLHAYFDEHPKGRSTIRNTLQYLAQLWKALHTLDQQPPVPRQAPRVPRADEAAKRMREQSPFRHLGWLQRHRYTIPPEQWPADIATQWDAFALPRLHEVRRVTSIGEQRLFAYYVSYQLLSPAQRLDALPDEAQAKLQTVQTYTGWRREIITPSIVTLWSELFDPARINSFLTWSAWRGWRWQDEILKEREPHRPSTQGRLVAALITYIAKRTDRPNVPELDRLLRKLKAPLKMHDKTAPIHRFELSELEAVALELITEARRMQPNHTPRVKYPGTFPALRFQLGLILQLAWRNPMRARNWCEAILGHNLKQDAQGQWRWRFVGDEMKIGRRGEQVNVFEPDVPPAVAVHLDEFLTSYRPHIPHAATNRHVFLTRDGTPMTSKNLWFQLRTHVNRYTGKHLYTHLLRSLFSTHHLSHGMDINSVAYAMNDTPASVLKAYNQLMSDTHRPVIADANQRALANGYKPLTPPMIPNIPKPPKPMDPNQMVLI